MKRILLLLTVLFSAFHLGATDGRIIFVQAGNSGQGTSWEDATGDLQGALAIAQHGDQIWVAKGTYLPSQTGDRTISFNITDGVQLYGGFEGNETTLAERNSSNSTTILSGEIGDAKTKKDNSYTVVYTSGVSNTTIVDGFTICDGMANALIDGGEVTSSGAAWFNDATTQPSSPTIKNCTFSNNYAREGAGLYNYAEDGECYSSISNCTFIKNHADFDGGAIYNNGMYGVCNIQISDCHFSGNDSYYGAGILNKATRGEASTIVKNCLFIENISTVRGSAIYCYKEKKSICEAVFDNCKFENNGSVVDDETGGAVKKTSEKESNAIVEITITTEN